MTSDAKLRILQNILKSLPDSFLLVYDSDGKLVLAHGDAAPQVILKKAAFADRVARILAGESIAFEHEADGVSYDVKGLPVKLIRGRVTHVLIFGSSLPREAGHDNKRRELEQPQIHEIFDRIGEGIQIVGRDWRYIYLNDAAAEHGMKRKDELLGKTMMEAYPGIEKTEMFSKLSRCMKDGLVDDLENQFSYQDGTRRWFRLLFYPVREGVLVQSIDETEWKESEKHLQRLNRFYAVLSGINQAMIRIRNTEEIFSETCRLAVEVGDFPFVWIGMLNEKSNWIEPTAHFGKKGSYSEGLLDEIAGGMSFKGPTMTAFLQGKPVICNDIGHDENIASWKDKALQRGFNSMAILPLKVNGQAVGTVSFYSAEVDAFDTREITLLDELTNDLAFAVESRKLESERLLADQELKQHASLLDLSPDAIFVQDLDGRIQYLNKGAESMFGWKREDVLMKTARDLLFKGREDSFDKIHKSVLEEGHWYGETKHIVGDNREIVTENTRVLLRDDSGRPESELVIKRDVTERKALENQYLRAQRLESIGTLAGGIAHDLNNVLTPILLALQYLKQRVTDPKLQKILDTVEATGQRGAELVKQVLSFARGVEGEKKPVQLYQIVEEAANIIKETFPKSVSLRTNVPRDLPLVAADPTQLHQVLMNLCVNARDAMPDGGSLTIRAEKVELDEQYAHINLEATKGAYIVLNVTDTGMGMPPQVVERIFEPFFTTKEINKGTGLGLSTVHAIVKSHGGFVNVYSEVGKGTTFRIYLPSLEAEAEAAPKESAEVPAGKGELILIVEDEKAIQEITKATLESNGYSVISADDGTEGVAKYIERQHEIALVLTDMMMPYMDGASTIRALRKINPAVRIVAVSGLKTHGDKDDLQGNVRFLPKPYTASKLLEVVHNELR